MILWKHNLQAIGKECTPSIQKEESHLNWHIVLRNHLNLTSLMYGHKLIGCGSIKMCRRQSFFWLKKKMFPKWIIILGRREYIYYIKNPHEKQPVSKPTCSKRTTSEIMSPIGRRSFTTSVLTLKGIFATTWEKKKLLN